MSSFRSSELRMGRGSLLSGAFTGEGAVMSALVDVATAAAREGAAVVSLEDARRVDGAVIVAPSRVVAVGEAILLLPAVACGALIMSMWEGELAAAVAFVGVSNPVVTTS